MQPFQAAKDFGKKVFNIGNGSSVSKGEKWISLVSKYYKQREKSSLEHYHREWFKNIAMRSGMQWLKDSLTTPELLPPSEDENRVRMTINEMLGIHTTKVAKLTRESPVWTVSIETEDDESKDMARADEALLRYAFQHEEMELIRLWFLGWAVDTGNCFWKIIWDHDAGGIITDPFTGEAVPEGDAKLILVPPFDVIFSYGLKTRMEDASWMMHVHEEPLTVIKDDFPEGGRVKGEREENQVTNYQRRLMSLVGNQNDFQNSSKDEAESAVVKELYIKQCGDYPLGGYIAVANGVWLNPTEDGKPAPLPYKHLQNDRDNPYPFVHMIDIPVSGSPWGIGTMQNLRDPQIGFNRVWSQVIENGNNFGNIKILAPKSSDLTTEAFDDSGNEVIEYSDTNGVPPSYLQPVGMPNTVMSQFDLFQKAFMSIGGSYEASKGDVPSGVRSGIAIARLQDADDTRVNPTMIIYRSCLRKAGKQVLHLYREFMLEDEERMVKIMGHNGVERFKVSRDKLADSFTVFVELESSAAWAREVKREQIQNAYSMGLFGDANDPRIKRKVLEALEFGHLKTMFEDNTLDEHNAKDNIQKIETGQLDLIQPPQPRGIIGMDGQPIMTPPVYGLKSEPWEDHEEHVRVYNNFRKGPSWKKWDQQKRSLLNKLSEEHEQFLKPPPPAPIQPKVSISGKTSDLPPEVLYKVTGMEPPTPQPMEPAGPPFGAEIGANEQVAPPGSAPSTM